MLQSCAIRRPRRVCDCVCEREKENEEKKGKKRKGKSKANERGRQGDRAVSVYRTLFLFLETIISIPGVDTVRAALSPL